jgi:hypothetical protein
MIPFNRSNILRILKKVHYRYSTINYLNKIEKKYKNI